MFNKKHLFIFFFGLIFFSIVGIVSAQESEITFPVAELGNCANKESCKTFCDSSDNYDVCIDFAEKHNIFPKKEIEHAKKFIKIAKEGGPGGCKGEKQCRSFCDNSSNIEECLVFGQKEGLISEKEVGVARQVLKEGGPGGCKGEDCRKFCQDPANIKECVAFGKKYNLINEEDAKRAEIAVQGGPGGCRSEKECRDFCGNPANQENCLVFAEEHNLIPKEELEKARKFMSKPGPGGCQGPQGCRDFCNNPDNQEECLDFAEREGVIPKEEFERAKNFIKVSKEGGPGGCKGEECRKFCQDPANQEECFNFAKKNNLISENEQKNFQEHVKQGMDLKHKIEESGGPGGCKSEDECRNYCGDPGNVEECIAFGSAHANIPQEESKRRLKEFNRELGGREFRPEKEFEEMEGDRFKKFEEFKQLEQEFRGKPEFMMSPQGTTGEFMQGVGIKEEGVKRAQFVGPGGCSSPDECIKYCKENKDSCFSFGAPGQPEVKPGEGGLPPGIEMRPPQLRQNLLKEFKPGDFPSDFKDLPKEDREKIFKEKFKEKIDGFPKQQGEFPGKQGEFQEFKNESRQDFKPEELGREKMEQMKKEMEVRIKQEEKQNNRKEIQEFKGFEGGRFENNILPSDQKPRVLPFPGNQPTEGVRQEGNRQEFPSGTEGTRNITPMPMPPQTTIPAPPTNIGTIPQMESIPSSNMSPVPAPQFAPPPPPESAPAPPPPPTSSLPSRRAGFFNKVADRMADVKESFIILLK